MYGFFKRLFDIVASSLALLILTPLLVPVMIILLLTAEHEVFFLQERVGYRNRTIKVLKFVTMRRDSHLGGTITMRNDPRVLPFGRLLRKSKINELPQLVNILIGDMSFVGPRPLTREAFDFYPPGTQSVIRGLKPGLTGIASVVFSNEEEIISGSPKDRYDCYREDIMPRKGALEEWYAGRKSFLTDAKLILLTAVVILRPQSRLLEKWFADLPA
jgi:lipopolysaccharide/colanic/teichoic acid biosynthesis glycosyltransferase